MSQKQAPTPVFHKFSELVIDPILSCRSPKEIRENAKELAKEMEAFGSWDAMQPGQVFTGEDGKLHVCAGFTRIAASESLGYKGGWFFELDGITQFEAEKKAITTNGGKAISRLEQGKLFTKWEAGIVADDFAGVKADPKNEKDWKVQPMNCQEIAEKIGKSREHVSQCITIANVSPEIAELIETDQISHNIVVTADQWAKGDDAKMLRILKRAVREAGNEKATKKHMDAIKHEFVHLKAKTDKGNGSDAGMVPTQPSRESNHERGEETSGEQDGDEESESTELSLGEPEATKPPTKKEHKSIRDAVLTVILETDSDIDDDLAQRITDRLIDAGLIVTNAPF